MFLSHCLLNENTRYPGGACRRCCVAEIIDQCIARDLGMIQMPCPEQQVWGGVLKRRMLRLYGAGAAGPIGIPAALWWVRRRYRQLARSVAAQIEDYVTSGFEVAGVIGIDASPTCGVEKTLAIREFVAEVSRVPLETLSVRAQNDLVRRHAVAGRGLFIAALERELDRRGVRVPLLGHDLLAELEGRSITTLV